MDQEQTLPLSWIGKHYPASGIRRMFNLAAQYDDIVNLTLGEPNFDTPVHIREAAKKALDEGYTHYTPNAGMPALREAVAEKFHSCWDGYTAENVIITIGALEALTLALIATVGRGDEVLIPDPCFPNYVGQVMLAGAEPVCVPVYEENDHKIAARDIEKAVTDRTRAIILNSPSNPLGAVLDEEDVLRIAEVAAKHRLLVFSDEVYDQLLYDGRKHFSMARIPELRDQVFVINGFSKSYAMTGWRIGYLLARASYIPIIAQIQEGVASCVSTFTQIAAVQALRAPQDCVREMAAHYLRRRDILIDGLNAIPGIACKKSAGSFYAFANISGFGKSSQAFAEDLLQKARVLVVPGSAFGRMGEGYVRFVFANSDENLHEAVRRIRGYVAENY